MFGSSIVSSLLISGEVVCVRVNLTLYLQYRVMFNVHFVIFLIGIGVRVSLIKIFMPQLFNTTLTSVIISIASQ